MGPNEAVDWNVLQELNSKLTTREMQLKLVLDILENHHLLKTNILSSVCPKIGKTFQYRDLELKKTAILLEARIKLLRECSVIEAKRDIQKLSKKSSKIIEKYPDNEEIKKKVKMNSDNVRKKLLKAHEKKTDYFLGKTKSNISTQEPPHTSRSKWKNVSK